MVIPKAGSAEVKPIDAFLADGIIYTIISSEIIYKDVLKAEFTLFTVIPLLGIYLRAAVPNLFGTRDRFHGRQFFHEWGGGARGSGSNASDGERQMKLQSLARLPLTSCCAAWFIDW